MGRGKGWLQWLGWLQPQYESCIMCGKPVIRSATPAMHQSIIPLNKLAVQQKLCDQCLSEIVWIEKILCVHCGRRDRCPDCIKNQGSALWLNRSAVCYNEAMKQWLHRYKFQGDERLGSLMGRMLLPAVEQVTLKLIVRHGLEQQWKRSNKTPVAWLKQFADQYWDVVTAVPLSGERYRERGFNQAELLAKAVSSQTSIPYYELLVRQSHSDRHSHKNRQARMENIANRYGCSQQVWNEMLRAIGKIRLRKECLHILLIDDVYTTGSTVRACAEALMQASPVPIVIASVTWARS